MDAVGIILSTVKVEISDQPCGDLQQNFGFFGFFRFLRLRWCWLPRSLASASNSGFQAPQRGSPQVLPRKARATLDSSCFQGSKAYSRSGGVRDLHHRRAPGCWAEPSLNRIGVFGSGRVLRGFLSALHPLSRLLPRAQPQKFP